MQRKAAYLTYSSTNPWNIADTLLTRQIEAIGEFLHLTRLRSVSLVNGMALETNIFQW